MNVFSKCLMQNILKKISQQLRLLKFRLIKLYSILPFLIVINVKDYTQVLVLDGIWFEMGFLI